MKRGTIVKVNDNCNLEHLIGKEGIVVGRSKKTGYVEIYQKTKEGFIVNLFYKETHLDIIEQPIEV